MTDEHMDARLRAAGESWRAANDSGAAPDPDIDAAVPLEPASPRRRRHRTTLLASAAVVAAALVAGGAFLLGRTTGDHDHSTSSDAAVLTGRVWRLLGYNSEQQRATSTATLIIRGNGQFVADDECTIYSGRLGHSDGRLSPARLAAPRDRGCTDSTGPTFLRWYELLTDAPRYTVTGNELTVEQGRTTVRLQAAPALPAPTTDVPSAVGATWRLTGVRHANGTARSGVPDDVTLKIDNGALRTSDGCNAISGEAAVVNGRLVAKRLAMTEVGCADMATQIVIGQVLTDGAKFEAVGPTLTVSRPGSGTLSYEWQPDDEQATDVHRLTGRTWHLASIAGESAAGDVELRFDGDGRLTGHDGCEDFAATVDMHPGWLTANGVAKGPPASCAGPVGDQATTVDSFLRTPDALWSMQASKLVIYGGGAQGYSLVFAADDPPAPTTGRAGLTGREWKLTGVERTSGNSASGSGSSDTGVSLAFGLDGRSFQLTTPCRGMKGDVEIGDSSLTFGDATASGVQPCRDEFAKAVDAGTTGTVRWKIDGNQLTLTNGGTTLTFESS
jgi:heat shock protein HslJ